MTESLGAPGPALVVHGTAELMQTLLAYAGVTITTYRLFGEIDHGSFAFENPTGEEMARRRRLAAEEGAGG